MKILFAHSKKSQFRVTIATLGAAGDPDQGLTKLPRSEHQGLHKDLNDFLRDIMDEFGNHMRPQRGNSGQDILRNFGRDKVLEALRDFYRKFTDKYPEAARDFFKQHPELKNDASKSTDPNISGGGATL